MKNLARLTAIIFSLFLVGCSSEPVVEETAEPAMVKEAPTSSAPKAEVAQPVEQSSVQSAAPQQKMYQPPRQPQLIKITGIGYGAESTYEAYTPGQRRLMAIRAAKLDAYRSLAEQIHGIKIDSNTSVSTLTAKNDSFRARVNAIVRGARVVSVTPMADRNYETVLEVFVDRGFFNSAFVYTNCPNSNCNNIAPIDPQDLCNSGLNCQSIGSH